LTGRNCVLIGTIYTFDSSRPEAEGVAIHDGKIIYVGEAHEARRRGGPRAEILDLGDRIALPGFVESHSHPILLGRYLEEVDCRYCSSIGEIVKALRQRASTTPPGRWVVGNGYDHTLLKESRHPTRRELDRVSDKHPVLLRNITVHNVVTNSQALRLAGVTATTPDPEGGRIGRDVNGEPDGVLWEWAQGLVQSHLPEPSLEDIRRQLENAAKEYLSAGVTSVVDAALGLANGMRDAEERGRAWSGPEIPRRYVRWR
jgi:predicted amidohydrolase YtcJ